MSALRRVVLRKKGAHIEAPGCIVNVYVGLHDRDGREVTSVEVIADGRRYAGEPKWWVDDKEGEHYLRLRVVQEKQS